MFLKLAGCSVVLNKLKERSRGAGVRPGTELCGWKCKRGDPGDPERLTGCSCMTERHRSEEVRQEMGGEKGEGTRTEPTCQSKKKRPWHRFHKSVELNGADETRFLRDVPSFGAWTIVMHSAVQHLGPKAPVGVWLG